MSTVWYLRQQLPYKTACPQEGRHVSTMSLSSSGYMDSGAGEFRRGPSRNPCRVCKWHLRTSQGCQQQLNLNRLKVSRLQTRSNSSGRGVEKSSTDLEMVDRE